MREEGVYLIKRVDSLPKNGNANLLYALKSPRIDKVHRWVNGSYEEISIGEAVTVGGGVLPYTQYSANVTATALSSSTSGLLTLGVRYVIYTLEAGDDFSNSGYVAEGVEFVATATTPTVWTNSTVVVDLDASAPSAVVLFNNTGVTFTWGYDATLGETCTTSSPILTDDKVQIFTSHNDVSNSANEKFMIENSSTIVQTGTLAGKMLGVKVEIYP